MRLARPARLAAAMLFGALALSGCANNQVIKADSSHGLHTVRMTVSSTDIPAHLTYQLGHRPEMAAPVSSSTVTKFASATVKMPSGSKLSMTGGPPAGPYSLTDTGTVLPTDSFTCAITVDGVLRVTNVVSTPFGATPPTCSASGYVGRRPFQVRRLLEFIAFGLCLLIVIFGIAVQLRPGRQRA
jgi:hypothetical protein